MNIVLIDFKDNRTNLLPLTYTRPISELRCGILTIKQKWQKRFNLELSYLTEDYLTEKYPLNLEKENLFINAIYLPDNQLFNTITQLPFNSVLMKDGKIIAFRTDDYFYAEIIKGNYGNLQKFEYDKDLNAIENLWDIFVLNGKELEKDFYLLTKDRKSIPLSKTNLVFNEKNIFVEEGAVVEGAVLNPLGGYIYIGKESLIMEGSVVRGSLALCEHSQLKIGAKIYGPTTIGPYSKVGGEVSNSVIIGYSNKAHDGFLGNSVLGEWCNLGAGTNNSNLKNNYAEVKLWNYKQKRFVRTGLQFCGLIMADHSKCGINSMFNTGTVVGVSANIFGSGFPRNFIPSFAWGGVSGFQVYKLEKAFETAEKVMKRRNKVLNETEKNILKKVFEISAEFRNF